MSMSNNYHFYLHFPSGHVQDFYANMPYHIGDKIIFEGESGGWIIDDIQHQFRDDEYILTNVILLPWEL